MLNRVMGNGSGVKDWSSLKTICKSLCYKKACHWDFRSGLKFIEKISCLTQLSTIFELLLKIDFTRSVVNFRFRRPKLVMYSAND